MAAGDVTVGGTYRGWHGFTDSVVVTGTVQLDGSNPTPIALAKLPGT